MDLRLLISTICKPELIAVYKFTPTKGRNLEKFFAFSSISMSKQSENNGGERAKEKNLIERIRQGDLDAENELFKKFGEAINFSVYHHLKNVNAIDREEVIGEINVIILEKLRDGSFDPTKEHSLNAYISGIARNMAKRYFENWKREQLFIKGDKLPEKASESMPDFEVENQELRNAVRQILSQLDVKYQEICDLYYYQGLKIREISQELNLPSETVSNLLSYAKKQILKECVRRRIFPDFYP